MKKIPMIFMAAALAVLSLQAYGQGHSANRSNAGGQLRGDKRSDEVHDMNTAKKKAKKGKKNHKFALHHHTAQNMAKTDHKH